MTVFRHIRYIIQHINKIFLTLLYFSDPKEIRNFRSNTAPFALKEINNIEIKLRNAIISVKYCQRVSTSAEL